MAKQPTPKKPTPKQPVRSAGREAMNESGGNIISKKPKPKSTLVKEVVKVRNKGNETITQYPATRTPMRNDDGKKVYLTKQVTRIDKHVRNKK